MNEQLQLAVATILDRAITGIDSSVEFMQAELPEVIEQLLMWYGVKSAIMFFIGALLVVITPVVWFKWIVKCKEYNKNYQSDHESYLDDFYARRDEFDMYIYPAFLALAPLVFGIDSLNIEWLQIWIAPKIWLMEYAASIVK